jgi:hypothetical protein
MMRRAIGKKKNRKGEIWVSAIIYTMVAVLALVIIMNTGIPLLTELKDRSVFEKVKGIMLDLDMKITEIANQGEGSQATLSFEIRDGEMKFRDNKIIWEIETKSEIVSPRTSTKLGNLIISSNANVRTYQMADYYVMETEIKNDTFRVVANRLGSKTNPVYFNTSQIIENISFNGVDMPGTFTFNLNGNMSSAAGVGYIEMLPGGNHTNVGKARIVAHMDTNFSQYDLVFVLNSYADFVAVNIKNVKIKNG